MLNLRGILSRLHITFPLISKDFITINVILMAVKRINHGSPFIINQSKAEVSKDVPRWRPNPFRPSSTEEGEEVGRARPYLPLPSRRR